jgi:hypothetical protein
MPVGPVVALFGAFVAVVGSSVAGRGRAHIVAVVVLTSSSGTTVIVHILFGGEQAFVAFAAVALEERLQQTNKQTSHNKPCHNSRTTREYHTFADQHCSRP